MSKSYKDRLPLAGLPPSIEEIETKSPYGDWSMPPYIATAFEQAAYLRAQDPVTGEKTISFYVGRAFEVVEGRLLEAFATAPTELQNNQDTWPAMKRLMQVGVYGDLFGQIQANVYEGEDEAAFADLRTGSDKRTRELLYKAANGVAMPIDVIELLVRKPQICQMEVANQTAPLDWTAFREMDAIIDAAMLEAGFEMPIPDAAAAYSVQRFDYNSVPKVALLIRELPVGALTTNSGVMTLTQRDTFVADMTKIDTPAYGEVRAWLRDAAVQSQMVGGRSTRYDGERFRAFIDSHWDLPGNDLQTLLPVVRSYQAAYSPTMTK